MGFGVGEGWPPRVCHPMNINSRQDYAPIYFCLDKVPSHALQCHRHLSAAPSGNTGGEEANSYKNAAFTQFPLLTGFRRLHWNLQLLVFRSAHAPVSPAAPGRRMAGTAGRVRILRYRGFKQTKRLQPDEMDGRFSFHYPGPRRWQRSKTEGPNEARTHELKPSETCETCCRWSSSKQQFGLVEKAE